LLGNRFAVLIGLVHHQAAEHRLPAGTYKAQRNRGEKRAKKMKKRKSAHSAERHTVLRPSNVCGFLASRRKSKKIPSVEEMDKAIAEAVRKRHNLKNS